MTLQIKIAKISGIVSFISLVLSWLGYRYAHTFLSNVFMGVFSSGILICGTSIITFFSECRKHLYQLYCECIDFGLMSSSNNYLNTDATTIRDKISQAYSLYNKGIQENVIELNNLPKFTKIYHIVSEIDSSSFVLNNSLIDLDNKVREYGVSCLTGGNLKIKSAETRRAAEKFALSVSNLNGYLNEKKIRVWGGTNHAH